MKKVFLSLGSNIGDRQKNLAKAVRYINIEVGHLIDISGVYESEPWGFEAEHKFYNMVIEVLTNLDPELLLIQCLKIEEHLGRKRSGNSNYESRLIDIDVLFYESEIISDDSLTVPHPHLHNRKFILEPLCEIAPGYVHPIMGMTVSELLRECRDKSEVEQLSSLSSSI